MIDAKELKELFLKQKEYVNRFFDVVDEQLAFKILNEILSCKGTVIFSGVGKSGIVASKLAMTLVSIGTKSLYLNPLDALHGDIGAINHEDLVIFLSKSGSTKELLQLVSPLKRRNVKIISWVSKEASKLAEVSDLFVILPLEKELCPFDLAPTTSPSIQMLFGDVLASAIMKAKNFSLSQYALNHPAGSIGQQLNYSVKDLMLSGNRLPTCKKEDLLKEVIVELTNKRCGCILVVNDEGIMEGIFTDGDLRRAIQQYSGNVFSMSMEMLMTKTFLSIDENSLAIHAMQKMQELPGKRVMMLPVVSNQQLKGLICMHDIISAGLKN